MMAHEKRCLHVVLQIETLKFLPLKVSGYNFLSKLHNILIIFPIKTPFESTVVEN